MGTLALLHASQLVTLAGPKRPRIGNELSDLGIIRDGGILIRDGKIVFGRSSEEIERNLTDKQSSFGSARRCSSGRSWRAGDVAGVRRRPYSFGFRRKSARRF